MFNNEYMEEGYQKFLRYVKSTWNEVIDWDWGDWKEKPVIDKVIISSYKNEFEVFVYLKGNPVYYDYDFKSSELLEVTYEGKAIKTEYSLRDDDVLYMMLKGTLLNDLGLEDIEVIMSNYTNGLEVDEKLSKSLESAEESYAETMYCIEHDL